MKSQLIAFALMGALLTPAALAQDPVDQIASSVESARTSLVALKRQTGSNVKLEKQSGSQIETLERIIHDLTRLAATSKRTAAGHKANADATNRTIRKLLGELDAITVAMDSLGDTEPPIVEPEPGLPGMTDPPVIVEPPVIVDPPAGRPMRITTPFWFDAHDAAGRTAQQNKDAFMWAKRNSRNDPPKERIFKSLMNAAGAAPDMGDMEVLGQWSMCVGSSRHNRAMKYTGDLFADWEKAGSHGIFVDPNPETRPKSGNIDIARCSFQPHPTWASTPKRAGQKPFWPSRNLKWGFRRYNLGDTTVTDCDFSNIHEEHGCYDDISGHALYQGSTFWNSGGQALQVAHRSKPYQQYPSDNMPFTGRPIAIVDDCHAVDLGQYAARRSYNWTFFDYGIRQFPATIILRNCTTVQAWEQAMIRGTNEHCSVDHPDAVQSSKGVVITQSQHADTPAGQYNVEFAVMDNCVFDFTQSQDNFGDFRGCETILVSHCTFINRDMKQNWLGVDSPRYGNASGTFIIQDCISPDDQRGFLRIMGTPVMYQGRPFSLHCPGQRFEIDVATRTVREVPMKRDQILDLISPLEGRGDAVKSGFTPQPDGHVDDLGTVRRQYRRAG